MLDAYPDAELDKPYRCVSCDQYCSATINHRYCMKCWNDMKKAQDLFNSDKSPLDFMITSGGSVRLSPTSCERCNKKFRFWRREYHVFDREAHKFHHWKIVCIDCINMETDVY